MAQVSNEALIFHWKQNLDPIIEVPCHEVGTPQIDLLPAAIPEVIDATMLQEAAHDAGDMDVLAESGDPRAQTAYASHQQVHLDAGLRRLIEQLDHRPIDDGVHFEDQVT